MEEILASIRRIIADDQSLTAHRQQPGTAETPVAQEEVKALPPEPPVAIQPVERPVPRVARPKFIEDRETAPAVTHVQVTPVAAAPSQPAPKMPEQTKSAAQTKTNDFSELQLRPKLDETVEEKPVKPIPAPVSNLSAPAMPNPASAFEKPSPFRESVSAPAPKPVAPQAPAVAEEPLTSSITESSVASSFAALFTSRLLPDEQNVAEMTRELLRPMLKAWLDDNLPVMVERLVRAEIERVARGGR